MKKFVIPALALLSLTACAGSFPAPYEADYNPQAYAGITHVDAKWKENGEGLERIQVFQGKEGESFDVTADLKNGTVTWSGKNVKAFDGQALRAAVEQAVSADVKEAFPGIVDAIVKAVTGL